MTKAEAVREFKRNYRKLYIDRVDYWTAHLAWSEYVDSLNKDKQITDKQASTWSTPFPYGKQLSPSKAQLEMEVNSND